MKQIAKVGLPLVLIGALFSLTEITDNISLGLWAPKNAIGIANFAGRLYWIAFLVILMFPSMFSFLVAQYYGAKDYKKEKQVIANVILFSVATSIISLIVIHVYGKNILTLFIKRDDRFSYYLDGAYPYVKIFSYLMIVEAIIQGLNLGVMAEGKTKMASLISALVVPLNILFNYIFMKAFKMGTIGCAWSTLFSWSIVFVLFIIWIIIQSKRNKIKFGINPFLIFKIDRKIVAKGFKRIGNGLSMVSTEIVLLMVMTAFSKNYSDGIIVTSIVNPFFQILLFIGAGVVSTKSHFVGTTLGAGRFKKAYEIDSKINFYAFIFAIANAILIAALAYPIPLIYTKEASHHKMLATYCLLATSVTYPLAILAHSFVGGLASGGKSNQVFVCNSLQPLILEVGVVWLVVLTTNIPFFWLYALYRLFEATRVVLAYLFWRQKTWLTNETNLNVKEI